MSYFRADAPDLQLKFYGESLYDNIVFFAPVSEKLAGLSFADLTEFSNEGGNILFGLNKDVSDSVRGLVSSLGLSVHKKNSEVIDHFSRAVDPR